MQQARRYFAKPLRRFPEWSLCGFLRGRRAEAGHNILNHGLAIGSDNLCVVLLRAIISHSLVYECKGFIGRQLKSVKNVRAMWVM
jgi:hypothetical protein